VPGTAEAPGAGSPRHCRTSAHYRSESTTHTNTLLSISETLPVSMCSDSDASTCLQLDNSRMCAQSPVHARPRLAFATLSRDFPQASALSHWVFGDQKTLRRPGPRGSNIGQEDLEMGATMTTGPVGSPVGEPPSGSMLTAT